ncbi:MAG: glycosyltransferase [Aggregatilineales bacterium]
MPPQRSGIAEYSFELLEWLATLCDVEVFTDRADAVVDPAGRYPLWPFECYTARAIRQPFDLNVYHIGNGTQFYEYIYRRALEQPGLAILHDISLFDLHSGSTLARGLVTQFFDEVEYCEGIEARAALEHDLPAIANGQLEVDHLRFLMTRRLIDDSRMVLVHSQWARDMLREKSRFRSVEYIPMGARVLDRELGAQMRTQLEWTPDQLVIGMFGGITQFKRAHVALEAFQQLHRRFPHCRMVIAGREVQQPGYVARLRAVAEEADLGKALTFLGELSMDTLEGYLQAVDLVINLRWPTAGETSAIMMRAFGAGKVVITSDTPQFLEYDPAFCWRVTVEPEAEIAALSDRLDYAATHLAEVRAAGEQAREYVLRTATWPLVAEQYRRVIADTLLSGPSSVSLSVASPSGSVLGVNVIGDLTTAIGLSEATVNTVEALLAQHIPVAYTELLYAVSSNQQMQQVNPHVAALIAELPHGNVYPINLLSFNLHELPLVAETQLRALTCGKYTIAQWFWELNQVPLHFRSQVGRVDELWVPSDFTRRSFALLTKHPIKVIPPPVAITVSPDTNRASFGLPDKRYLFFFHFSAISCNGRKNPLAVVRSFERAFGLPLTTGPLLVIKAQHLSSVPEYAHALHQAVERVGGILLTDNYTRQQMNDLLECIDVYVSLHRSEGFGLGMAEAMYLGKPVIATDYSGNTDFMTADNSYPVRYDLRLITPDDHVLMPDCGYVYEPGQVWAEPDVQHAAEWMNFLHTHPDAGHEQGRRAAESIRRFCSPAVVGQTIARRLRELAQLVPQGQE